MKSLKRKNILGLLAIFLSALFLFTSCAVAEQQDGGQVNSITVFSWEDYIDEGYDEIFNEETGEFIELDGASEALTSRFSREELTQSLIEKFKAQTGITVNYYSFATCEEMYNELLKNPQAVDLLCPSEYMIMKMKNEDLIQSFVMPENYDLYGSPYIKQVFEKLGLVEADGKTYAMGYMWGTMGLIYNEDVYDAEDFDSWSNLLDKKFYNRLTIKDSLRDSYILSLAIVFKDELLELKTKFETSQITETEYSDKLFEIFNRADQETVNKSEEVLSKLKANLYGFEVDAGKSDILTGKIDVNFAWSGDAVYSMYEGDEQKTPIRLGYAVPLEGSNVWFDGYVMTKDANVDSSLKFLNFLSDPDNVIRNMEYVGYTSCVGGQKVFDYVKENFGDEEGDKTVDLGYFFGDDADYSIVVSTAEDGYARHLYAQYADEDTIKRCAVMDNFTDDALTRVNYMWNNVKLINFPVYIIIILCAVILLIIAGLVVFKFRDKILKKLPVKDRVNKNRAKYKVVSIKKI